MASELPEDKMIQEGMRKNPTPAWVYLAVIAVFAMVIWGGASKYFERERQLQEANPFVQVTNRDFSLFLWQFPEYMRANVSMKAGYLTGFQYGEKIAIEPGMADEYVAAPPNVLFLYHAWNRLLGSYVPEKPIDKAEFLEFLEYSPEWKEENWNEAPKGYEEMGSEIPLKVKQAFFGWKDFFYNGEKINQVKPTYEQMEKFLTKFPHYARNDWRNILMKNKPDYLKDLFLGKFDPKAEIPEDQLAPFLKVGYYEAFAKLNNS